MILPTSLGDRADVDVTRFTPKPRAYPLLRRIVRDGEQWVSLDDLIDGLRKQGQDEVADALIRYRRKAV